MRRIFVLALSLGAALLLAVPAQAAPRDRDDAGLKHQRMLGERPGVAQEPLDFTPVNDNFGRFTYNHFGDPLKGQVNIETWLHVTLDDLGFPIDVTPRASAEKLRGARRVAFRVETYTENGLASSSGAFSNTGDVAAQLAISSPTFNVAAGQHCIAFQVVYYNIRWNDGTLSSEKTFFVPGTWWNDNCYFLV